MLFPAQHILRPLVPLVVDTQTKTNGTPAQLHGTSYGSTTGNKGWGLYLLSRSWQGKPGRNSETNSAELAVCGKMSIPSAKQIRRAFKKGKWDIFWFRVIKVRTLRHYRLFDSSRNVTWTKYCRRETNII